MRLRPSALLLASLLLAVSSGVWAQEPPEIVVSFLGDRFEPAEVVVPVNVKFALRVDNKSAATMEWESLPLHREKVVQAGTSAKISIGPLRAGSYEYFDEFHPKIRGHLVAR